MFRYKIFFIFLCCWLPISSYADLTSSQPNLIAPSSLTSSISNVYVSCNSATGQSLATWTDIDNSNYPTYSFYTPGTGWSAPATISNSFPVKIDVITSCDPETGSFLATWTDSDTNHPIYSIYTPGVGWNPSNSISTATAAVRNTANSFNSITGQFLATWADNNNNHYPTYSFYTPGSGWSSINTISTSSEADTISTSFDSSKGQFLATWVDIDTGFPMYSFYNMGIWSASEAITILTHVDNDVFTSYNPTTGQFLAAWADINNNFYPTYSIFTYATGWSAINIITNDSRVLDNVTISCDFITGQFLALWNDVNRADPTYSLYTPNAGWSPPTVISTTATSQADIISSFDPTIKGFLATWVNSKNFDFFPTYSFLTYIPPPPSKFTGSVLRNRFLTRTNVVNKLAWDSPSDTSSIVSYQITKNGEVIASVPVFGALTYYDQNPSKKTSDIYTITAVNASGIQSVPLSVTLP